MPKLNEQTLINGATYLIDGVEHDVRLTSFGGWQHRKAGAGHEWHPAEDTWGLDAFAYLDTLPETFKLADVQCVLGTVLVTVDGRHFTCCPGGLCDEQWKAHALPGDTQLIAAWDDHTPQNVLARIDEMTKRIAAENDQTRSIDETVTKGYEFNGTPIRPLEPSDVPEGPYNNPVASIAQPGYLPLADELFAALEQSQSGKGKERHANDKPFLEQPIMRIAEMTGPGGTAFQAIKKIQESLGMHGRGDTEAATRELHGAMVYAAATILAMRKDA